MKLNPTLRGFLKKEFIQTLRDKRMRVVLFVAPVVQLTIFGVALSNEVRRVRLAASFSTNDTAVQTILNKSFASGWFIPATVEGSDPYRWLESNEAEVVLVAPPGGLLKAVGRGEGALQVLVDSRNVIRAQAIENYLKAIVPASVPVEFPPMLGGLQFDVRVLYNPTLLTSVYMVPGVMCMLVCLVTILLTSMALAKERETGTLETLIAAPLKPWELLAGKTVPFVVLGFLEIPLILGTGILLFQVPARGSIPLLLFAGAIFVCATVSLGVLIALLGKSQQQAMLGGLLFLLPAVLLSGLLFPLENVPWALRWLGDINPLAHFISLIRNLLLKGGNFHFYLQHLLALTGLAAVCIGLAYFRFKKLLG
jgi:ABC-2 type transport system permease protein